MSSYWAGYHGTALVLDEKEFDIFLDLYAKHHTIDRETLEEMFDDEPIDEYPFLSSKTDREPRNFEILKISDDTCDGMCLYPYYRKDGTRNRYEEQRPMDYQEYGNQCYVIFSDKDLDSLDAFFGPVYPSYDTFVQEFKDKVESYLPEDFDWNQHIGRFSYACYA